MLPRCATGDPGTASLESSILKALAPVNFSGTYLSI